MSLSFAICVAAVSLELGAVVLLLRKNLWREYPFFFAYAIWLLLANSAILLFWFRPVYSKVYWYVDTTDIVLRLLVVWEVFRQTFPKNSGLSRSFSKGLGIAAVGLLITACAMFWGYESNGLPSLAYPAEAQLASWRPHLALDRSFGVVEALMILGTLVVARYYGVRCGRNIRGIAFAFGAWASISTANNAMIDLANSFVPLFYYLRPLSFVLMLVVWIWALWVYEPNPPIKETEAVEVEQWTEEWNRTISTARTILRP